MKTRIRRLAAASVLVPACALTLAACAETVDAGSAANVIKNNIGKLGPLKATNIKCPDGVNKKAGISFTCTADLESTSNGAKGKAKITLHIVNGGNTAEFTPADVHIQ